MRRGTLSALIACAALAVPTVAVADAHGRSERVHHHRGHHGKAHRRQLERRIVHVAAAQTPSANPPAGAATVVSFENGKLTIALADGSTISGAVTDATEIRCEAGMTPAMSSDEHGNQGDDQDDQGNDENEQGDDQGNDHNNQGDDNGNGGGRPERCGENPLTPGAVVLEADLHVGSGGAIWEEVELA
jgi:hypothetical protein